MISEISDSFPKTLWYQDCTFLSDKSPAVIIEISVSEHAISSILHASGLRSHRVFFLSCGQSEMMIMGQREKTQPVWPQFRLSHALILVLNSRKNSAHLPLFVFCRSHFQEWWICVQKLIVKPFFHIQSDNFWLSTLIIQSESYSGPTENSLPMASLVYYTQKQWTMQFYIII